MKARVYLLGLVVLCSACAAPSARYKKEVYKLVAANQFEQAAGLVEAKESKVYAKQDWALAQLDRAALLHDANHPAESDRLLDNVQHRMDELYTKSASKALGKLLINDLTSPYYTANYERAMTHFYRGMNFLDRQDVSSAAVEARKAVFFLDNLRGSKKGYNDDPFVQYFASLLFESVGQVSDARIARQNAFNAYERLGGKLQVVAPQFAVPENVAELGEVILFHYNGLLPLKKTQTIQFAWNHISGMLSSAGENADEVSPQVQNALAAGFMGRAITISYPVLEVQPYYVAASTVDIDGNLYDTQKVADLGAALHTDLEEKLPGMWIRAAVRVITKQILAEQARQAVKKNVDNDIWGDMAGWAVNLFGAATERADTRQWFTLPNEIRMSRIFVRPGTHQLRLLLRDGNGNVLNVHTFEPIEVPQGGRVFLHFRSAY